MGPLRPYVHPLRAAKKATPPQWPSYQGTSQFVGTSRSGVTVWVDPSLGSQALQNANDLLADADRIVGANQGFFGTKGGPVDVILFALGGATDGTGGADHNSCDFITGGAIEVCVAFGQSMRCSALFEAELSECSMNHNLCGLSTGEALSRWCAMDVSNNALADFSSAPVWQQDGMPDFVNVIDQTDTNYDSIGCGMAFLSWLMRISGKSLSVVAQEMVALGDAGTLAALYNKIAGDSASSAWPKFGAAVSGLTITSDDPFGAMTNPVPVPVPTPVPTPTPTPTPIPSPSQSATIQGTLTITGTPISIPVTLQGTLTTAIKEEVTWQRALIQARSK